MSDGEMIDDMPDDQLAVQIERLAESNTLLASVLTDLGQLIQVDIDMRKQHIELLASLEEAQTKRAAVEVAPGVAIAGNAPAAPKPQTHPCLLYTSPSPRDRTRSRMPSSA